MTTSIVLPFRLGITGPDNVWRSVAFPNVGTERATADHLHASAWMDDVPCPWWLAFWAAAQVVDAPDDNLPQYLTVRQDGTTLLSVSLSLNVPVRLYDVTARLRGGHTETRLIEADSVEVAINEAEWMFGEGTFFIESSMAEAHTGSPEITSVVLADESDEKE